MERQPRVLGIGFASVDLLGIVDHLPGPDALVEMRQFTMQGGGNTATALVTMVQLGLEAAYVGTLSDDLFGRFILEDLRQAGVDTDLVRVEPGRVSPFTFIAVESPGGHRVLYHTRGNCAPLPAAVGRSLDLSRTDALFLDGFQPKAQVAAAERAAAAGIPVFLDASRLEEGMGELLNLADILLASERFAAEVAPVGELEDALQELLRLGPDVAVITLGQEGSIGSARGQILSVPALDVDVVDTTGAGDVYRGAFVYAWLQGWDLGRSMRFATAAASLSCTQLGARAGLPLVGQALEAMERIVIEAHVR